MNATVETRSFGVTSDEVVSLDNWVDQIISDWGEGEQAAFRIRICLAELAANVLEYGGARSEDCMVVTLRRRQDGIDAELVDPGRPFDPTRAQPTTTASSIEDASPGGRGLMLVRSYADEISYRRDGARNRVVLKFTTS